MKNNIITDANTARDIYFLIAKKLKKNERALIDSELIEYDSYRDFFKFILDISQNKEVLALAEKGLSLYNYSFPSR